MCFLQNLWTVTEFDIIHVDRMTDEEKPKHILQYKPKRRKDSEGLG
jgi:hypothetical protein